MHIVLSVLHLYKQGILCFKGHKKRLLIHRIQSCSLLFQMSVVYMLTLPGLKQKIKVVERKPGKRTFKDLRNK